MQIELLIADVRLLSADHSSASLGVLSGVILTEDMVETMRDLAGAYDENFCEGATFDSLAQQVRQMSDILVDGSQPPNQTCNAISIGLGFEAVESSITGVAPAAPPPLDPCPE